MQVRNLHLQMTRKFKYSTGLAILTGAGIIIAQVYWLIQSYQVKEANLTRSVEASLSVAIFQTVIEGTRGMDRFILAGGREERIKAIEPAFTMVGTDSKQAKIDLPSSANKFTLGVEFVDSNHPPVLSANDITPITIQMQDSMLPSRLSIDDSTFLKNLKGNLQRSKIDLPFELSIESPETSLRKKYLVSYPSGPGHTHDRLLLLNIPSLSRYLLKSMMAELLLSAVIIIIACISFYYLLKTIFRQKQFAEMKNDFISNISHELKTPVSVMMATNEALIKFNGVDDKERTERYLVINRDELNKLQGMIERIVSIGKQENTTQLLSSGTINPAVFLQKIVNRFAGFENLQLRYTSKLGSTGFATNEEALETILTNLIDNAIKYNDKLRQQVWIDFKASENGITITVQDDGIGIEKKYLLFVFDKFYRVPNGNLHNVKGFGLGLSQVKELVEQMKGTIEIFSEPGSGTQFIIHLPFYGKD